MTRYWPRFWVDASYNFNTRDLRGGDIWVLPCLRLFPPMKGRRGWTIHFGWLFWTVGLHQYRTVRDADERSPR